MTKWPKWDRDLAVDLLDKEGPRRGGLLPALHLIQETFGHVPEVARDLLADRLNLSRAEVLGVVSFYDDFRDRPADLPVVRICRGEACQAMGADALVDAVKTRDDVELEDVFCLGNCACGPSAQIGRDIHGRVSIKSLGSVLAGVQQSDESEVENV